MSAVEQLAAEILGLKRQVRNLGTAPQLAFSSIEDGAVQEYTIDGSLVQIIGKQFDGTHMAAPLNGPQPPTPTAPTVTDGVDGTLVHWDGNWANALMAPMDHARLEIHASMNPVDTFLTTDTLRDTIETPRGGDVWIPLSSSGPWYIAFVARSLSGQSSLHSAVTASNPVMMSDIMGATIFYGPTTPTGMITGDLWYHEVATNEYQTERWTGSAWVALNSQAVNSAIAQAIAAQTTANTALANAATAQTTANAKATVFRQTSAPSTSGRTAGDVWFDIDDDNKVYLWTGAWTSAVLGTSAVRIPTGDNLAPDPRFERGAETWLPSVGATFVTDNGASAARMAGAAGVTFVTALEQVPARPGDKFYIEAEIRTDVGSTGQYALGVNPTDIASGSLGIYGITAGDMAAVASATVYTKVTGVSTVLPATAVNVAGQARTLAAATGALYVRNIVVRRMTPSTEADFTARVIGGITTYYQTSQPGSGMLAADLWVDTDDGMRVYRYSGSAWQDIRDASLATAITSFYQSSAPSSVGRVGGDLWIDTDDGNRIYRWNGAWTAVVISGNALSIPVGENIVPDSRWAEGGVAWVFPSGTTLVTDNGEKAVTTPAAGIIKDTTTTALFPCRPGDTFYLEVEVRTDPGTNGQIHALGLFGYTVNKTTSATTPYMMGGPGPSLSITAASVANATTYTKLSTKITVGSDVAFIKPWFSVRADATTGAAYFRNLVVRRMPNVADVNFIARDLGGIATYYQTTAPATGMLAGDLWIDTDDNMRQYRYSGSAWQDIRDSTIAIAQLAADSALLADSTNFNPTFSAWTGSYPVAWQNWVGVPTKETTLSRTKPNAVRYTVDAVTQGGILSNSLTSVDALFPLPLGLEYVTVEVDVILVSGSLTGAGVLIDWTGMTGSGVRQAIRLDTAIPSPVLGKVYRVSKVLRRTPTLTGTQTSWSTWLMANYAADGNLGALTAKDIIFDRISYRPSTQAEIETYGNGVSGWIQQKATIFTQTSAPPTTNRTVGDAWFDTDDGNKVYIWNGSAWTASVLGNSALGIVGGGNLLPDSQFATNPLNTAIWSPRYSRPEAISSVVDPALGTPRAMEIEIKAGMANYDYPANTVYHDTGFNLAFAYRPIIPLGTQVVYSVWVARLAGTSPLNLGIQAYNSAGTYLGNVGNLSVTAAMTPVVGQYYRFFVIGSASPPAGTDRVDCYATAPDNTAVVGDKWRLKNMQIEVGQIATAYSPKPDEILPGTVDTTMVNFVARAIGGITTYYQTTAPASGMLAADLWVDTDDGNKVYRYSGSAWVASTFGAAAISATARELGSISTYAQTTQPASGMLAGDLWYDTDDGNRVWRYSGSAWLDARDTTIATAQSAAVAAQGTANTAVANAATAQTTANGKITSFFQTTAPASGMSTGDLWYDSDDSNRGYRYSGSAWVLSEDTRVQTALNNAASANTAAGNAQTTANSKIVTFTQTSAPTASATGDLWVDSDDSNRLYRWSGSAWVDVRDTTIAAAQATANSAAASAATAITNAQTAQSTADGKAVVYFQTAAPTGLVAGDVNDLWIDSDDSNKVYRWTGSAWALADDQRIGTALTNAATANTAAGNAQTTANSKIIVFYQISQPSTSGRVVGDLWVDTDDGNKVWAWNGSAWTATTWGLSAINTATVTARALGSITTYYQTTAPASGMIAGDFWIDTDDGNKLYRYSTAWNVVQDTAIQTALTNAGTAQATADGKVIIFPQTTAPTGRTAGDVGDMWIDTDDGNRIYTWDGSAWADNRLGGTAIMPDAIDGKVITGATLQTSSNPTVARTVMDSTGFKSYPAIASSAFIGALDATQTLFEVTDNTSWMNQAYPITVQVDSEKMTVLGAPWFRWINVVRGVAGTTAATHQGSQEAVRVGSASAVNIVTAGNIVVRFASGPTTVTVTTALAVADTPTAAVAKINAAIATAVAPGRATLEAGVVKFYANRHDTQASTVEVMTSTGSTLADLKHTVGSTSSAASAVLTQTSTPTAAFSIDPNGYAKTARLDIGNGVLNGPLFMGVYGHIIAGFNFNPGDRWTDLGYSEMSFSERNPDGSQHKAITLDPTNGIRLFDAANNLKLQLTTSGRVLALGTADASVSSTGHNFQSGADNSLNIRIDNNEIMAVNNGVPAVLYLNNGTMKGADASTNGYLAVGGLFFFMSNRSARWAIGGGAVNAGYADMGVIASGDSTWGSGLQLADSINSTDRASAVYNDMKATAFAVQSSVLTKEDIRDIEFGPLDALRQAPSKHWRYKEKFGVRKPSTEHMFGPMAEDLPETVTHWTLAADPAAPKVLATDLTSMIGVLWAAVRELDEELDEYRKDKGRAAPKRKK